MKEFVVIWKDTESKFTECEEAIDYAKYMTRNETEHPTAIIIKREGTDDYARIPLIMSCNWITENLFELVNLIM